MSDRDSRGHTDVRAGLAMLERLRRWPDALGAIAVVALAIRLVYVFGFKNPSPLAGDGEYYHATANALAQGHGFVEPILLAARIFKQTAHHPPGYIVALAIPSVIGLDTPLAHQIWSSLLGTGAVVVVGLAGRRLSGPRVGLVAAGLAAIYPNFWLNDGLVMSETLTLLLTALMVLAAYRLWGRPGPGSAALLGLATAGVAYSRGEGLILLGLLVVPLVLALRGLDWRRRLRLLAVAETVAVVSLAPWIGYNLSRFEEPVLVSHGLGYAMNVANCDPTYRGEFKGYWNYTCGFIGMPDEADYSEEDRALRRRSLDYMEDHAGEVPGVVVARLGRTWGFYHLRQQLQLDGEDSSREVPASYVGLGMYYALVPAALIGAIVLRRRRVTLIPFSSLVIMVSVAVAVAFGQTRYRAPAEVALVLLAAVAVDAFLLRGRTAEAEAEAAGDERAADAPPRDDRVGSATVSRRIRHLER